MPRQVDWQCPVCKTSLSSTVEEIGYGGHKALEDPLVCPTCGKFTAMFNFQTNRVEPRRD